MNVPRLSKQLYLVGCAVLALALLVSCNNVVGSSGGGAGSGAQNPVSTASRNLQEMPDPEVTLPASLAAGESSVSTNSISTMAQGDITGVTRSSIPDVKAEGWYEVRAASQPSDLLRAFVTEIREIAAERDLQFDTVYQFGTREFYDSEYDMGRMKLTGNDPNNFTVWWYPQPFPFWETHIRLDVKRDGDDWEVVMRTTMIQDASTPEDMGGEGTAYDYAYFNTATDESVQSYVFERPDDTTEFSDYTRSFPNPDGSVTFVNKDRFVSDGNGVTEEQRVGWGDDTQGGVIVTGEEAEGSYASKEFYDGNGGLVMQSWGESTLDTGWLSWVGDNPDYSQNLAALSADLSLSEAPNTVYAFRVWVDVGGGAWEPRIYVSLDADFSDGDNVELSKEGLWDLYYRSGSDWGAGDALYNWDGDESASFDVYAGQDGDESGRMITYSKGYQVPNPTSALGDDYYFRNQFPFKQLLPLKGDYEGKPVRRREGETFTEEWGSWTHYEYFVDCDNNGQLDEGQDANDRRLDNVWLNENYIWDPATDTETLVKAPFFSTTGMNLPSYFSVPDHTFVSSVKARIDEAYATDLGEIDRGNLPAEDISNSPQFDDLKN